LSAEIDWFRRLAAAYLRWSHFNMDRIVRDIVKKNATAPPAGRAALEGDALGKAR
jgi:hypothetical protein